MTTARRAIFVAPFEELSEPRLVAELAARAEARGWDGFFLWDHFVYPGVTAIADPWITLAAVATATERLVMGTLVTPLARRRPLKRAARHDGLFPVHLPGPEALAELKSGLPVP